VLRSAAFAFPSRRAGFICNLYRALQEDLAESPRSPEPLTVLDPLLAIFRTAEAIAVPMAFAKAMGLSPEETTLRFEFRWSGLEGRVRRLGHARTVRLAWLPSATGHG